MYYQEQARTEPQRPGVLMAGVMTVFGTVVLTLGTTLTLVLSYQWVTEKMTSETSTASDEQFASYLQSNMIIVIAFYAIISLVLAVGAIMTMRQQNAGRILVWIGGGILAAVNLCCGLAFSAIVTMISEASQSAYSSSGPVDAPTTELTMATIFTFTAVVAAIVAMILLGQRSVGLWIKGNPQLAPGGYAVPGMVPGAPMPGSPVAYPQQQPPPYQAPPPPPQQQYPPQYGPGSYGDQYGPGQQPYNGGDQYGPGNPTSGPPNQGW